MLSFKMLNFLAFLLFYYILLCINIQGFQGELTNCFSSFPDMDVENVIEKGKEFSIGCDIDSLMLLDCMWTHVDPITLREDGPNSKNAIRSVRVHLQFGGILKTRRPYTKLSNQIACQTHF